MPKFVRMDFGTRLKVFKAKNTIIRTLDLVPKSVRTNFGTRSKVFKAKNTIIGAFYLVPKYIHSFLALDRMHYLNFRSSEK